MDNQLTNNIIEEVSKKYHFKLMYKNIIKHIGNSDTKVIFLAQAIRRNQIGIDDIMKEFILTADEIEQIINKYHSYSL